MIVSNQIDGLLDVFVISSSIDCSDIVWTHLIVLVQIKSVDFQWLLLAMKISIIFCVCLFFLIFYMMVKTVILVERVFLKEMTYVKQMRNGP